MKNIEIIKTRDGQNDIELETADVSKEIYVDGVASLAMGMPCSKVIFTSSEVNFRSDDVEKRREVLRLSIPTHVLLEVANIIHSHADANRDFLSDLAKKQAEDLQVALSRMMVTHPKSTEEH